MSARFPFLAFQNLRGVYELVFGSSQEGRFATEILRELGRSVSAYHSSQRGYGAAFGAQLVAGKHPGLAQGGAGSLAGALKM